jgi:hypothetical protein
LDENEEIEVLTLDPNELDKMILDGQIWCGQTVAAWAIAKEKFTI